MTDPTRWRRIEAVFDEAADLPTAERAVFLDDACRTPDGEPDGSLREEVEALLAADVAATIFFEGADAQLGAVVGDAVEEAGGDGRDAEQVGPWRLVERVGRGGMGEVWRAERADGAFEQTAAVKLVRPGLADDVAGRFRAERQILAGLDHPNVARLLGGGRANDGRPWLAMEFVEGESITAYCDRRRLTVNERLALFGTVCDAVAYAHRSLVVHRDLKPSNVLVADDGTVKLLDFGIAKLLDDDAGEPQTRTGRMLLTPEYAAPEQVTGGSITTATDVYALGALLYELLTGRRTVRVDGRSASAVEKAVLETEPTRPSEAVTESAPTGGRVPSPSPAPADGEDATGTLRSTTTERLRRRLRGDLDRIVMKALRKEPDRRYEGAASLAADVRRHLDGLPVEARPDTASYRISKFVRRHRAGVAAAALALLAVVGGAGAALWQAEEATRQRDRAEAEARRARLTGDFYAGLFEAGSVDAGRSADEIAAASTLLDAAVDRLGALDGAPVEQGRLALRLADVLFGLDDFVRADSLARLAVVRLPATGPTALDRAEALALWGQTLTYRGHADSARVRIREALDLYDRHAAPADSLRLVALTSYADAHDVGAPQRVAYYREALAADSAARGPRTVLRGQLLAWAGIVLWDDVPHEQAIAWHREALAINRALLGETDFQTIAAYNNLALDLEASRPDDPETRDEALGLMERAVRASAEALGRDHPGTLDVERNWGSMFVDADRPAEAVRVLQDVLARQRTVLPPTSQSIAPTHYYLGRAFTDLGRPAEGVRAHRAALAVLDANDDAPASGERLRVERYLGVALHRSGRAAEAERVLTDAIQRAERAGADAASLRETLAEIRGA